MNIPLFSSSILIGLVVSSTSTTVSALPQYTGNPCTYDWTGPQNSASDIDCEWSNVQAWFNADDNNWAQFIPEGIVVLVGVILFIAIPFAMICRLCCGLCGNSKLRPDHGCCGGSELDELDEETKLKLYTKSEVWWTKFFTYIALLMAVVACAIAVQGAVRSTKVVDIIQDGPPGFAGWVNGKLDEVKDGVNTSRPAFKETAEKITSIQNDVNKFVNEMETSHDDLEIVRKSMIGLAAPTALLVIAGIMGTIAAACSVRFCLPASSLIITMFAALICGCLGLGSGMLGWGEGVWCHEIDAYRNNETGLFKWYIEPQLCEEKIDFPTLKKDIQDNIKTLVKKACDDISDACDASPAFVPGSNKPYYCPQPISCSTTQDLVDTLDEVTVKSGVPGNSNCSGTSCSVKDCAEYCGDSNLKSQSGEAVSAANDANSANNVIQTVLIPIMSCEVVINKLLDNFNVCNDVKEGTEHVFAGCFVGVAAALVLTIVLFMGQKRYISRDILDEDTYALRDQEHFAPHEKYMKEDRIHV